MGEVAGIRRQSVKWEKQYECLQETGDTVETEIRQPIYKARFQQSTDVNISGRKQYELLTNPSGVSCHTDDRRVRCWCVSGLVLMDTPIEAGAVLSKILVIQRNARKA